MILLKKILIKKKLYNIFYFTGITVGLTVIPQAIAYAGVAGLPPQYGLYSSFMACFVYTVFGSVKDSAIGPTAIAAILTRENLHGLGPEFAVLLAFLSGCVELVMGILQLGESHLCNEKTKVNNASYFPIVLLKTLKYINIFNSEIK